MVSHEFLIYDSETDFVIKTALLVGKLPWREKVERTSEQSEAVKSS